MFGQTKISVVHTAQKQSRESVCPLGSSSDCESIAAAAVERKTKGAARHMEATDSVSLVVCCFKTSSSSSSSQAGSPGQGPRVRTEQETEAGGERGGAAGVHGETSGALGPNTEFHTAGGRTWFFLLCFHLCLRPLHVCVCLKAALLWIWGLRFLSCGPRETTH